MLLVKVLLGARILQGAPRCPRCAKVLILVPASNPHANSAAALVVVVGRSESADGTVQPVSPRRVQTRLRPAAAAEFGTQKSAFGKLTHHVFRAPGPVLAQPQRLSRTGFIVWALGGHLLSWVVVPLAEGLKACASPITSERTFPCPFLQLTNVDV